MLGWIKEFDIVATIMKQEQGNCAINEITVRPDSEELRIQRENDTRHTEGNDTRHTERNDNSSDR